jgi:ribosomal protein S18 acetylase RimI-like enzyme
MAARSPATFGELIELRELAPGSLDSLLSEEIAVWRRDLRWDFHSSAALVRKFADEQTLGGHALISGREVLGYAYTVAEGSKGLVGDLFVREPYQSEEAENRLLAASVDSLAQLRGITRIEAQILLLNHPRRMPAAYHDLLQMHERQFMQCPLEPWPAWRSGPAARRLDLDTWNGRYAEEAARLLADAYDGHVDSQINDQYRSLAGSRKFLSNIVEYPGCGSFDEDASWLAWNRDTGRLAGMCMASRVADDIGHITQVCIAPSLRGQGIGYELMIHSMRAMRETGCTHCSLTVTSANRGAIGLYERMGFITRRRFAAMVWDGIRPPKRGFFF